MSDKMIQEVGEQLFSEMRKVISGQQEVMEELLIAIIAQGHVLFEGPPGVGKTMLVNTIASLCDCTFKRIQFTPDLMPSDIIGNNVFNFKTSEFILKKGPVFTNFLLGDEINRTPPKTQAALLEAMGENQVTIDGQSFQLEQPFVVFATQNPIEQEGTYPLPEAQVDRFLMKVLVSYPASSEEKEILKRIHSGNSAQQTLGNLTNIINREDLLAMREQVKNIVVEDSILDYILAVITATRQDHNLLVGGSPRASIALLQCAKSLAALNGKTFVTPDEVKRVCYPVLRHRLILKPEVEIEGLNADDVIRMILDGIQIPR